MRPTLRLATLDDAAAVAEIYAPYVLHGPISLETEPPDADEMRARLARVLVRLPWLVLEEDGALLGYAHATEHGARRGYRFGVDVAVYLARSAQRRGLGTRLYGALLPLLRAQGYVSAYAGVTLPNEASVRLHTSFGFTAVGVYRNAGFKLGRWYDVGWWQRALAPPPAVPAEPVPLTGLDPAALVGEDDVLEAIRSRWVPAPGGSVERAGAVAREPHQRPPRPTMR